MTDPQAVEDAKVAGAIRTDMILSAEIMAITLAQVADQPFALKTAVLAAVGLGITLLVYGAVALIVKLDDIGVRVAAGGRLGVTRAFGRGLVKAMPPLLKALSLVGTAAMLWVGGGIVLHSLAGYGYGGPEHALEGAGLAAASFAPLAQGFVAWLVAAAGAGVVGLVLGAIVAGLVAVGRRIAGKRTPQAAHRA